MQRLRFFLAESGFGFRDLRFLRIANSFASRDFLRLARASSAGSGDEGRSNNGRCLMRSLKMDAAVSGECARASNSSAGCSLDESIAFRLNNGCNTSSADHGLAALLEDGDDEKATATIRGLAKSWRYQ